jgi:hypothetical protein
MTLVQRNAVPVSTTTAGLLIYQTDNTPGFYFHTGSGWKAVTASSGANTALSNLSTTTAISQHLLPGTTAVRDLGSAAKQWRHLYLSGNLGIGTTAPEAKLEVRRTDGQYVVAKFTNGATTGDRSAIIDIQNGNAIPDLWRLGVGGPGNGLGLFSQFYIERAGFGPVMTLTREGNIGMGTTTPAYPLDVTNSNKDTTVRVINKKTDGFMSFAIYAQTDHPYGVGIKGAGRTGVIGSGSEEGVSGYSYNGHAIDGYSTKGYGIYGSTADWASYAGYFAGNVFSTGSYLPSARSLKQNITDLSSAMSLIVKLQPKEYEYKQEGIFKSMHLPQGRRYGLIAEEVEEMLPGLIKETAFDPRMAQHPDSTGTSSASQASEKIEFKAVNYIELIPILIKGMQEQNAELQAKDDKIAALEARLTKIETLLNNGTNRTITSINGTLEQNMPNPVRSGTRISYSVPEGAGRAQLVLTDALGRTIKSMQLSASGVLNIDATALSSGVYNYSLIVDGKTVQTRKMTVVR